ncbi:MAG: T9SS type A sorting domain-containing protein [Bacteroidales bacterium]|nr:T9SS type A sorting domain-containing protein [Bacteroidales bacterium]
MKKGLLFYSLLSFISVGAVVFMLLKTSETQVSYSDKQSDVYNEQGINGAVEYYNKLKADPITGQIDPKIVAQTRDEVKAMASFKGSSLSWDEMGPNNVGGRVRGLIVDKDTPTTLYAGGVSGGLWKSTTSGQSWVKIPLSDNIAISCIAQAPNGDIYVGTGEGLSQPNYSNVNSGMYGQGIYHSTDGITFTLIASTSTWNIVNRIAVDKDGVVYAATQTALYMKTSSGWSKIKNGTFKDVKVAPNSTRVVATQGGNVWITDDAGVNFTKKSFSGVGRAEIGISPSDDDVIYAVLAGSQGDFKGIHQTTDGGASWTQVAIGNSPSFDLFGGNNQGWYDNVCMVSAGNSDVVYVGGIDMWKGTKTSSGAFSWTRITAWNYPETHPSYVHADQHVYAQVPGQNNTFYAGTDGGIFKTTNGGASFTTLNKNFNVTQFYALGNHPGGGVIGGAQDNGTVFMDFSGNNPLQGRKVNGGDGGWAAASFLNQEVIFTTIYYSAVYRSSDLGQTNQGPSDNQNKADFYNQTMIDANVHAQSGGGPFVSNVILWETIDFQNSVDSIRFIADQDYSIGDTIIARSAKNNRYPSEHILSAPIADEDTMYVIDPVQSRLFFGTKNKIYMTPEALYFKNNTPSWYVVATTAGTVNKLRISKDGNDLFYTVNNKLYRLSGLHTAVDSASMDVSGANYQLTNSLVFSGGTFISSIVIDPADANRVGVTLGGYTNSYKHVYYSTNATSATPTFTAKGGDLPSTLPVYAGVIPVNNSKKMIIGTEYGMMMTDDITAANPTWVMVNGGIEEKVPVFMLDQQRDQLAWRQIVTYDGANPVYTVYPGIYNYGTIYAATHGRGFFKTEHYVGMPEQGIANKAKKQSLKLYPNPVVDYATIEFKLNKVSDVNIRIYDVSGRMVKELNYNKRPAGLLKQRIALNDLSKGAYFMTMQAGNQSTTNKFIVR